MTTPKEKGRITKKDIIEHYTNHGMYILGIETYSGKEVISLEVKSVKGCLKIVIKRAIQETSSQYKKEITKLQSRINQLIDNHESLEANKDAWKKGCREYEEKIKEIFKIIKQKEWLNYSYGRSTDYSEEIDIDESIENLIDIIKQKFIKEGRK